MLLINALYFCDHWDKQFDEAYTKPVLFKNGKNNCKDIEQGTLVDMILMRDKEYDYCENRSFQYIFILLPKTQLLIK